MDTSLQVSHQTNLVDTLGTFSRTSPRAEPEDSNRSQPWRTHHRVELTSRATAPAAHPAGAVEAVLLRTTRIVKYLRDKKDKLAYEAQARKEVQAHAGLQLQRLLANHI